MNFGYDERPLSYAVTGTTMVNPGDTNTVVIPFSSFEIANGTYDNDNGGYYNSTTAIPNISGVLLTSLPAPATSNISRIVVNGVPYTSANFPAAGITIHSTDVLRIDPVNNPIDSNYNAPSTAMNAIFPFAVVDSAGYPSLTVVNYTEPFTDLYVKGQLFDDYNGGTINGTLTPYIGANKMYVSLVDSTSGLVVSSRPIGVTGTAGVGDYVFGTASGLKANNRYTLVVSNTAGTIGQAPPATALTNAVNTGETTTGITTLNLGDLDSNGKISLLLGTTPPATDIDFAIDQLPAPTPSALASQVNPGGKNLVAIANTFFAGTDPEVTLGYGGTVPNKFRLTTFPTNIDSMVVTTGGVTTGYTASTFPMAGVFISNVAGTTVSIDPQNGPQTVLLPFTAIDNAGHESLNPVTANVTIPLTDFTLSGTVFNDSTLNSLIDGKPTNVIGANTLYVSLVDPATGKVIGSKPVASNGTYSFTTADGLKTATTLRVLVTDTPGVVGSLPSSTRLIRAANTAEGTTGTGDGTPDGIFNTAAITGTITGINFGIDLLPIPKDSTLATVLNTGGILSFPIPYTAFTGIDPDKLVSPTLTVRIPSFPANAYSITANGITYGPANTAFPAAGLNIISTSNVMVDPLDGVTNVPIPFKLTDNMGKESTDSGTVNLPITDLTIAGTIFDDTDGLTNSGIVNGTGMNTLQGSSFYANLISTLSGKVLGSKLVNANGTYSFGTADSIRQNKGFSVILSATQYPTGTLQAGVSTALGNDVVNTGEGTLAAGDGTVNGITAVTVPAASTGITGVNFGVDAKPVSTSASYTIMFPTLNSLTPLTATNRLRPLAGTDAEQGAMGVGKTVTITDTTGLNGNQLYYGATRMLPGSVIANYDSTQLQLKYTAVNTTSAAFRFAYTDAAGQQSTTPATYSMSFSNIALPIKLTAFTVTMDAACTAQIAWKTAEEQNIRKFVAEYSTDGSTFSSIGEVAGKNNPAGATYSLSWSGAMQGEGYYRLRVVELDGSYFYSNVDMVRSDCDHGAITLSPNPATSIVTVRGLQAGQSIRVLSMTGAIVISAEVTGASTQLQINGLASATYMVQVISNGQIVTSLKLVKQ